MSFKEDRLLALTSVDLSGKSLEELKELYSEILDNGLHGLCFSPYMEGQSPGDQLNEKQIRMRLEIIKPSSKWVRSFSCTEGNELIPKVARELGMKTLVGAWLSDDHEMNEIEIEGLIDLCNKGLVDVAAVGNEVMYRGELEEAELINYIIRVKEKVNNVPIGYVDAYYEFVDHPAITNACDVLLANCYPFWEGCHQDYSLLYMKDMYQRAVRAGNGKKVIITETGWPDKGSPIQGAIPTEENAIKYFINAQKWSMEEGIDMFYFSSFDESWKVGDEGDVGAYWGIWDKNEKLKFA